MIQVHDVAASHGVRWVREGFALFRRQPVTWIVLTIAYLLIWLLMTAVPWVGPPVASLLGPVFIGGLMRGCRALEAGEDLEIDHLFSGFRNRPGPLMLIGAFYLALQVLVGVVIMRLVFHGVPIVPGHMAETVKALAPQLLLASLLFIPMMMPVWFAPALLTFHSMRASHAVRWSVYATLSNLAAFVVFGVLALGLAMLAAIPFGLGIIVLFPTLVAANYASYRDVFEETA